MRNIFYTLLCAVFVGAETAAALTDAWSVDARQHTAVQRTYKQGETHDLTVTLRDGLKPLDLTGATAHFYWYTNATDNLWWTNAAAVSPSGLVTASWTPAMDTGAASYNWWIGIWQAGATSPLWRVSGTIRMLPSPGFAPNALPMPVRTLDLAAITITNAPWVTAADWASGSNALASAVQDLSGRIDALPPPSVVPVVSVNGYTGAVSITAASLGALTAEADPVAGPRLDLIEPETNKWNAAYAWGDHALAGYLMPADLSPYATTQQVAEAAAAIPRDRITTLDGSQWIDATGSVWRVVEGADGWALTLPSYPYEAHVGEIDWYAPAGYSEYADPGSWALYVESTGTGFDISVITGFGEWGAGDVQPISPITLSPVGMGAEGDVTLWLSGDVNTSRVDGVAWQSDLPLYATTQQVAAALAPMATTQHVAEAIASQLPGVVYSNAVSQMTIYTNASGAATSWWQVASGVTNSGSFASGTPGAITNGQSGPITIDSTTTFNNQAISAFYVRALYSFEDINYSSMTPMYGQGTAVFFRGYHEDTSEFIIRMVLRGNGDVEIPSGNVTVAKTNTAAAVRSQSSFLLPHLGTNTTISLIFTNGTLQAWEIAQ